MEGTCKLELDDDWGKEVGVGSPSGVVLCGGDSGSGSGRAGCVGREARGEGGGRTNELGKRDVDGGAREDMDGNDGIGIGGITSVSHIIAIGDGEARLDTRCAFRPLPAFPTEMFFVEAFLGDLCGDLWGDFFGEKLIGAFLTLTGDDGTGVGGNSANINSTCQERFSSKNLIRSA